MAERWLAECEREPLHLCGTIQPHGSLLALDAAGRITHLAQNVGDFLPLGSVHTLEQPLPDELLRLHSRLGNTVGSRLVQQAALEGPAGWLDAVATRGAQGTALLELTPHLPTPADLRPTAPHPIAPPADAAALQQARQHLVQAVAARTGFERVMYYQFREDGDGEVLAEARDPQAYGSYLGLRFPASDIPQIARALYRQNPWRLIAHAAAPPVPVLGHERQPLDLSWSDLRSVAPVHQVYMANMGVVASLSLPLLVAGQLVALVAAHQRSPARLPLALLESAAAQARAHSFALAAYQTQERIRLIDGLHFRFKELQALLHRHGGVAEAWPELGPLLLRQFEADGAMLCTPGAGMGIGLVPEPSTLAALAAQWERLPDEVVWQRDSLTRQLQGIGLTACAGVLALRIVGRNAQHYRYVYLTRQEHQHEVVWGGNPDKPVEYHDGQLGIAPRRSFEQWTEKRLGYCRPWSNEARLLALRLRDLLQSHATQPSL